MYRESLKDSRLFKSSLISQTFGTHDPLGKSRIVGSELLIYWISKIGSDVWPWISWISQHGIIRIDLEIYDSRFSPNDSLTTLFFSGDVWILSQGSATRMTLLAINTSKNFCLNRYMLFDDLFLYIYVCVCMFYNDSYLYRVKPCLAFLPL